MDLQKQSGKPFIGSRFHKQTCRKCKTTYRVLVIDRHSSRICPTCDLPDEVKDDQRD